MSKIYISPAMLPLDQIGEYMEKVEGFAKKSDTSENTKNVDKIPANLVAKAATNKDGALVKDVETIKNALELDNIPASDYLTKNAAGTLLADAHKISTNGADEIKNLRDELYQIKSELAKAGVIKNSHCYNGYIDAFREGDEKYIKNVITVTSSDNSNSQIGYISVEDVSDFHAGEYIAIEANKKILVAKIQDVSASNRINLVDSIDGPIPIGSKIYKSCGSYVGGSFAFGSKKEMSISSKEKYIILNDDAQPLALTKQYMANSGYAAEINIPSTAKGAVRRVGVQARVVGAPGGLKCYVIDPTNSIEDIFTLSSIKEMKDVGKVIGESSVILQSQATQSFNELYFDFPEAIILNKQSYMFLFVQISADVDNYWDLRGLRGNKSLDLQTNSKLYSFIDGSPLKAEDGDLYLAVVTSEIKQNEIAPFKKGLYTNKVELNGTTKAARVRVELKINREGRFKVIDNPTTLVPNTVSNIDLYNEDNTSYSTSIFNTGSTIAVGNQIAKVGNSRRGNTSFTLDRDVYAPAGSLVYRIGYKVQAKAYKKAFDKTTPTRPIKISDTTLIELPLVAIIPGLESGREKISSDRLIFEGEIKLKENSDYILDSFNELETQVYWENENATEDELMNQKELMGRILDITVSTDNAYNKRK